MLVNLPDVPHPQFDAEPREYWQRVIGLFVIALSLVPNARLFMLDNVLGCSSPRTRRFNSMHRFWSGSANAYFPSSLYSLRPGCSCS